MTFAKHAAENYGVEVVGITISQQQYEYAKQICSGLSVEIRFQDYRDVQGKFDRICSIGMFEHVGHSNYRKYMQMNWDKLKIQYDERFRRMWNFYLLSCAGDFRAREIQLWQIVFSKQGLSQGYQAPR